MKNLYKISLSVIALAICSVIISDYAIGDSNGPSTASSGDPASNNKTCRTSGCHTGPAVQSKPGWITSNIPVNGYIPGTTYTITATAVGSSCTKFGFQITPQSSNGTKLGTLTATDATNTRLVVSNKYITHTIAGSSGSTGSHTWTFNWTAPPGITNMVTFYGAFNLSNANNSETGDTICTSTLMVMQDASTTGVEDIDANAVAITLYPNPAKDVFAVSNTKGEAMDIIIIDEKGVQVKVLSGVSDKQIINIADITPGVYTLHIRSGSGVAIRKLIKN